MGDVRRQVARWTKPYRALAEDEGARARLVDALSPRVPAAGLKEAVEKAGALLWRELATAFDDTLRPVGLEGGIRASACRRQLLQLVQVAAASSGRWRRRRGGPRRVAGGARTEPAWRDPASCVDLLLMTLSRFYEHDRQRNFWHLDQISRPGSWRPVDGFGRRWRRTNPRESIAGTPPQRGCGRRRGPVESVHRSVGRSPVPGKKPKDEIAVANGCDSSESPGIWEGE